MISPFYDLSVFEYQDHVCVSDGREAVGDDQAGASLHQLVEAFLDEYLATGVDIAGCFVQ